MRSQTVLLLLASALCLAIALASCSSSNDEGPSDGSAIQHDPAACGCQLVDGVLEISWECYCAHFDCTAVPAEQRCMGTLRDRIDYPACGLTVFRTPLLGGPADRVYDAAGLLVGSSTSYDAGYATCPTDPSMKSGQMRAGIFPAAGCEARACATCSGTEAAPCVAAATGG